MEKLFNIDPIKQPKHKTSETRLKNGRFATKDQSEISHLKYQIKCLKNRLEYQESINKGLLMQLRNELHITRHNPSV